jgi:hypothetical protein
LAGLSHFIFKEELAVIPTTTTMMRAMVVVVILGLGHYWRKRFANDEQSN